jgi:hypothetical protein
MVRKGPIVKEVRAARDAYARRFGDDLKKIGSPGETAGRFQRQPSARRPDRTRDEKNARRVMRSGSYLRLS